jgi:hypothetical protein
MELRPNEEDNHEEQRENANALLFAFHALLERSLGPKKRWVKEERCECFTYTT